MIEVERRILKKFGGPNLRAALRLDPTLAELYHENTKLTPLSSRAYGAWISQIGRSKVITSLMAKPYKVYSLMDREPLGPALPDNEVERAIAARRSVRSYTGEAVSRQELSRLLQFSYGRTDPRRHYRAVASGGALYPLEVYAFALRVDGLEQGLYHYGAEHHELDVVRRCDRLEELKEAIWFEDIDIDQAAVLLLITSVFQRSTLKYKDRGYRMILMEAGEVAQNLALVAGAMGLGACLVGGFHDDTVSRLLEIDGRDEAPLLPVVVGRRADPRPPAEDRAQTG
jgi:SagB-type dehydrogenase family enzyme